MKNRIKKFVVEGVDWAVEVKLDVLINSDTATRLFVVAAAAIEGILNQFNECKLGAIVLVTEDGKNNTFGVNSYICLNRIGNYDDAQVLRKNFKRTSGQDLAKDLKGYNECK